MVRIQQEDVSNATSYMRPSVLDRIEKKGAAQTRPAVRRAQSQARRGPKHRPVYRLWEHATWRIRMRAWCNRIKSALLGKDLDLKRPQTYRVIQSANCPIDNASTWLTWWAGDAVPRPGHVRAAERLAPESSDLLDLSGLSTPPLRHLVALDILNTKFRQAGRPSEFQRTQSELLLTALNNAWAPFLSARPVGTATRFNLVRQIGANGAELRNPVRVGFAGLDWIREGGNLHRFAIPRSARMEYSWLEPMSIFRFLGSLTTFAELENEALVQMWACDFASAAMVVRTQLELAGNSEMPLLRMGRAGILYALAVNTFWAPVKPRHNSLVLELAGLLEPSEAVRTREQLRVARSAYYAAFAAWGIPERSIRALNADHRKRTWDGAFSIPRSRF
jgi:hypothetical protein